MTKLKKSDLFPIGIGTWGIGGFMKRDKSIDEAKQVDALIYMIEHGMNFVEVNMLYSQGYSVEILVQALNNSSKKRDDLFICQAIYLGPHKALKKGKKELDGVMSLFATDYIDTLQFNMGSFQYSDFEEITGWIDSLLEDEIIRYTSITNENLDFLQRYHKKYGKKLLSHEVVFNFEIRANEDLGIIPYAEQNNIQTVVYQPIRRNRTAMQNWKPLTELAEKYGKKQNQIIMNWITKKGYLPITKSETIAHIDQHLKSLEFEMDGVDYELLDSFKIPDYKEPKIDWDKSGDGVSIDQLSNVFDEQYERQNRGK